MSFLKNRTVVGVICILLSLLICFGLTPLFNQSVSQKAEIVRVVQPIRAGDEITESMVQIVEVGGYNLPEDVLRQKESAVGKYATADLAVGDYIIPSKLSDAPAAENAYLYSLDGSQQAISVSIKSFAEGLSGKLQSGDIVSVIAPDYKQQGQTVVPAELQYVEIISVTASSGYDANTGEPVDEEDDKELPDTVTLLVSPEQAKVLAELEAEGTIHLALVYRGDRENADKFLTSQDEIILELYPRSRTPRRNHRRIPQSPNPPPTPAKPQKRRRPRKPRRWLMLSFKKAGIFSRGSGQEDACEQEDQSGGVLAVWGSPGSGKTTVAVRLAKYLADKRRNVILLLCDMTAPMLPCICPAADLECERSLGSVLAAAHVSENLVKNNLVTHKRLGYLTMLGMLKGENEYTYPPYNEVQARELIDCLREIAPYVVIDCGSYIANDILSAVALMEADSVLRLANADLKSISYLSSQLPLLRDAKWDTDKQYKTASNVKSQQAGDHMSQALGTVAFTLPHSAELEGQYLAGNLLADLSMKDSRVFRKEIEKIAREVFGC